MGLNLEGGVLMISGTRSAWGMLLEKVSKWIIALIYPVYEF